MKKVIVLFGMLVSASVLAADPDFSILDHRQLFENGQNMAECFQKSWIAARPSDKQKSQAHAQLAAVKTALDSHMDKLKSLRSNLITAWSKFPVVRDDVFAARKALAEEIMPVRVTALEARINIVNLLSSEQRKEFDATFKACIKD